jgi:hypothetical protein
MDATFYSRRKYIYALSFHTSIFLCQIRFNSSTDLHKILTTICQFRDVRRTEGRHFRIKVNSTHFRPSLSVTLRCRCERLEYRKVTFQHAPLEHITFWKYRQSTAAHSSISQAVLYLYPQETLRILSCARFRLPGHEDKDLECCNQIRNCSMTPGHRHLDTTEEHHGLLQPCLSIEVKANALICCSG